MSSRRRAIGDNPLDSIIALPGQEPDSAVGEQNGSRSVAPLATSQEERRVGARTAVVQGPKRTRLTVKVSDDMVEELRDAVMFLHTKGVHTTLVGIIESAVAEELKRVKRKYNEGQDLPPRGADLPAGRPISA